nr:hypothetical protein [uncultured Rhodopila sp.]
MGNNLTKLLPTVLMVTIMGIGGAKASHCDNSSFSGSYALRVSGFAEGVFDSSGTLHPYSALQPITIVGQANFDGNGSFARIDYAVQNGSPAIPAGTPLTENGFRSGITGTYQIADDCTGILTADFVTGQINGFALSVVDNGQTVFGVSTFSHQPMLPPASLPSGTTCSAPDGCDLGVNLAIEFVRNPNRH